MHTSTEVSELQNALINLQQKLTPVSRDATGYGYKYATLDMVVSHIQPLLKEFGLGFVQFACPASHGNVGVTTRIIHTSGQWMEEAAEWPIPENTKQSPTQNAGAAFTYARRYGILAAFGIAAEDDTDAAPARSKSEVIRVYWKGDFLNRLREVIPAYAEKSNADMIVLATDLGLVPPYTQDEMVAVKEAFEKYAANQQ